MILKAVSFSRLKHLYFYLIYVLLLFTPLIWSSATSELFELPKMFFVYFIGICAVTVWIIYSLAMKKPLMAKSPLNFFALFFLFSQFISTIFSIHPWTSIFGYYSRFNGGFLSTLNYILLFFSFSSMATKRDTYMLLKVMIIGGIIAALYAFPEHFGFSPSCLIIRGDISANCWIQDVVNRVFGTFGQPNWLAAYLITLLPLSTAIWWKDSINDISFKSAYFWITVLLFSVILFTKSRSGLLGLAISLVLLSIFYVKSHKKYFSKENLAVLFSLLLGLFLLFGKGVSSQTDSLFNFTFDQKDSQVNSEISSSPAEFQGTESGDIRKIVWAGAINIIKNYPVFGTGVETFAYSYYGFRPAEHNLVSEWDFLYNKAHNEFINIGANTGLVGLGSYLLFILSYLIWTLTQIKKNPNPEENLILAGLAAGFLGLNISNFFGFSTVMVSVLFFLFPAFAFTITKHEILSEKNIYQIETSRLLSILLIFSLSLFSELFVFRYLLADINYAQAKSKTESGQINSALSNFSKSISLIPDEPTYKDEMSTAVAKGALELANAGYATAASQVAKNAIEISDQAIHENPVHTVFYKSRAAMFADLAQIELGYMVEAEKALKKTVALAPTDAKIWYNLGLVQIQLGEIKEAKKSLEQAVALKPNYEQGRYMLGIIFEGEKEYQQAQEQYKYILDSISPENEIALDRLNFIATQSNK